MIRFLSSLAVALLALWPLAAEAFTAPSVRSAASGTSSATSATPQVIQLPATVLPGDILIVYLALSGSATTPATWPAGWTSIATNGASVVEQDINYKVANGTEGGTTITVTATNASLGNFFSWSIKGANRSVAPQATTANTGGAAQTPPSITPSWGAIPTEFIVAAMGEPFSGSTTFTGYPANYTSNQVAIANSGASNFISATATRQATVTTETPGSFTTGTNLTFSLAATIAVAPQPNNDAISIPLLGM